MLQPGHSGASAHATSRAQRTTSEGTTVAFVPPSPGPDGIPVTPSSWLRGQDEQAGRPRWRFGRRLVQSAGHVHTAGEPHRCYVPVARADGVTRAAPGMAAGASAASSLARSPPGPDGAGRAVIRCTGTGAF